MNVPNVVDELGLEDFRRRFLAPEALMRCVSDNVHALVRLPVGAGKSHAVDDLLEHPDLFRRFDFVVYAAPAWNIIRERRIVRGAARSAVPWMMLEPRPRELCGSYDANWVDLERRSCSTYARATLCRDCQKRGATPTPCAWPDQLSRIKNVRLLLLPEQQLLLNRMLVPMLRSLAGAGRILVILDEARLLDASFEVAIGDTDLENFRRVLGCLPPTSVRDRWLASLDELRDGCGLDRALDFPVWLYRDALEIQEEGLAAYGPDFHNIGYDLALLGSSRQAERSREGDRIQFVGRPLLQCHVLALSASLTADYAGDRLGGGRLASPFEDVVFRHTGTRIVNLRSRIGADRYFHRNHTQILDTIAVLIAGNIERGVTTLLVSRKKSKDLSASYLTERLAGWGISVQFVGEDYGQLPDVPKPNVVPIIHYGILGVNDFADYQAAYCVNSYYISPHQLTRAVQEAIPKASRVTFGIDSQPDLRRRAKVVEGADPAGVLAHTGNIYLQKLELDPVVQAAGRVRFATKPREILFFQMGDLARLVGAHDEVSSLVELRQMLGIPSAREVDEHLEAVQFGQAIRDGMTAAQVAAANGISVRTVRRRLKWLRGANPPSRVFQREIGTPSGRGGAT